MFSYISACRENVENCTKCSSRKGQIACRHCDEGFFLRNVSFCEGKGLFTLGCKRKCKREFKMVKNSQSFHTRPETVLKTEIYVYGDCLKGIYKYIKSLQCEIDETETEIYVSVDGVL